LKCKNEVLISRRIIDQSLENQEQTSMHYGGRQVVQENI